MYYLYNTQEKLHEKLQLKTPDVNKVASYSKR